MSQPPSGARVAALYDIHGNIFALDAVLEEVAGLDVDTIVVGGDIVWGPFPRETLDRLLALGEKAIFIRGNADREVAQRLGADVVGPTLADINVYCAGALTSGHMEWLQNLPLTATIDIDGVGRVEFCHASPRDDEEILTPDLPDDDFVAAAEGRSGVIVCGHTHVQFDHAIGDLRVVNAGSVGLPYEDSSGAYWTLLGPDVASRRTTYPIDEAAKAMRASPCPHVESVFVAPLVSPRGREDALAHFTSMARARRRSI